MDGNHTSMDGTSVKRTTFPEKIVARERSLSNGELMDGQFLNFTIPFSIFFSIFPSQ
jgi:hypothetical protein